MGNFKFKMKSAKLMSASRVIIMSFLIFSFFLFNFAFAASPAVRLKDIAHVLEARDNQLMGFGLVVGLKNTGDTIQTGFTRQALTNLLSRMGIAPQDQEFKSRNVAAVMVTAKLPPYVRAGQKIDVTVSSLGDATSLMGGTLLMTPLQGPDDNVYAVAQGPVALGISTSDMDVSVVVEKRQTDVGRITGGGIVEKDVPVSVGDNFISIVLDNPDYTTATRIVSAMNDAGISARARDAATIVASMDSSGDQVAFIARVENLSIVPDTVAKIVINEQTGVIVMGENVRIAPVAVSLSGTNVTVSTIAGGATMSDLVSSLNAIGVKPADLVAIIQAIKSSGAISADIEVM